jgi:prolyl-tRNA synthetase
MSIAPYQINLIALDLQDESVCAKATKLYQDLCARYSDEVLFDDRMSARAGEKFADADLIGCPVRLVISKRTPEGMVEMKKRGEKESKVVSIADLYNSPLR